jgi:hypothetical protein
MNCRHDFIAIDVLETVLWGSLAREAYNIELVNCYHRSSEDLANEELWDYFTEQVDDSMLVNELITKLSSQSTEVHRDAAKTLRYLAKIDKENRVRIAEQGGIPFLINLLRSPDKKTQEHAITALMNLSLYQNNRGLIMRAGTDIYYTVALISLTKIPVYSQENPVPPKTLL